MQKIEVIFHLQKIEVQFGSYYTPVGLLGQYSLQNKLSQVGVWGGYGGVEGGWGAGSNEKKANSVQFD